MKALLYTSLQIFIKAMVGGGELVFGWYAWRPLNAVEENQLCLQTRKHLWKAWESPQCTILSRTAAEAPLGGLSASVLAFPLVFNIAARRGTF